MAMIQCSSCSHRGPKVSTVIADKITSNVSSLYFIDDKNICNSCWTEFRSWAIENGKDYEGHNGYLEWVETKTSVLLDSADSLDFFRSKMGW